MLRSARRFVGSWTLAIVCPEAACVVLSISFAAVKEARSVKPREKRFSTLACKE